MGVRARKLIRKKVRINEEIPENAAILAMNWKGKKLSKGVKFGEVLENKEMSKEEKADFIKKQFKSLAKSAGYTIDSVYLKKL